MSQLLVLVILLVQCQYGLGVTCPKTEYGFALECPFKCCQNLDGHKSYYCCGGDIIENAEAEHQPSAHQAGRADRFVAYNATAFKVDYTLLIIGLIVSIVLSILCSFLCCFLCNGCFLNRFRTQTYESVNESRFCPTCCGFGIPMGTVVISTHPPQFRDESEMYHGSSMSSLPSGRSRVRFNEDGTPKGVLKNNGSNGYSNGLNH